MRTLISIVVAIGLASDCRTAANAQDAEDGSASTENAVTADGEEINPRNRHSDQLTNQAARYFVWCDSEGWHVRSASKNRRIRRFKGTITLTDGTFEKLRAVGFERKGKYADTWEGTADRTVVEFDIKTSNSFDGIDFSVAGSDARVTFDLNIGGKKYPGKIFIGKDGLHPSKAEFSFPADP